MNAQGVIIIGGALALLLLGTRTAMANNAPRGIRNNNPGNIRHGSNWQGMQPTQSDPEYIQFLDPVSGLRAMARILMNYKRLHGIDTLRGVISRWAPDSENPTAAYIRNMEIWTGIPAEQPIDLEDATILSRIIPGIIRQENGSNPYEAYLIQDAIDRAR
jgi:hypothetical protein